MIYIDTSALLKKYVIEAGTERIRVLLRNEPKVFTSKLAYAEVCASFSRKYREGGIEKRDYQKVLGTFFSDWEAFALIDLHETLFPLIRRLTESHPLRGADAVHLSSALWIGEEIGQAFTFIASDSQLLDAARKERLEVMNPEGD